jgi:DNA-binding MarR family transcriptional regulator
MGEAQIKIGKKTKIRDHEADILTTLYDDGPQTRGQIADRLGISIRYVTKIMPLLRSEGLVKHFNRGTEIYWILSEDSE